MPKKGGSKGRRFTEKEDRQVDHIKKGYQQKGLSEEEAESRAYGTVVKQKKSGKKSGKKKS